MMNMLVVKIQQVQKESGLSDGAFADKVGIDRSTWSYIKSGKRRPGARVLSAIMKHFPQLTLDIMNYLSQN